MPTPAKTPSQCDPILSMLKAGKTLTTYERHIMGIQSPTTRMRELIQEVFANFGEKSPTTRMMELRRAGYPIICTMEEHINQFGQTVKRGRYSLASNQT